MSRRLISTFWNCLEPSLTWFWCKSYELAIFEKLIFNVLHSHNVRVSTLVHSELSIWSFGISYVFTGRVTTDYHMLPYMLPYLYGNFAPFLLVTIFSTLPEVLLNLVHYTFCEISTYLSIFQRVTMSFFLKKYFYTSF